MERLKTSDVSISNRNIKCPIGKSIFAVILPLKLFRVAVANVDIGNLSPSIHSLKMFVAYRMLVKFEQNRMSNLHEIECFDQKKWAF